MVEAGPPRGRDGLEVTAIRLPRTSNSTDLEALGAEPGVSVRWTTSVADVANADLVVLPGSRATVADLAWLRGTGLADAVVARAAAGRPVLGICGGFQMLARTIVDDVESGAGSVAGLDLLPMDIRFAVEKTVGKPTGSALGQVVDTAYEIHHGVVEPHPNHGAEVFLDGFRRGTVWGTSWHGCLDSDGFRRAFLTVVADLAGRDFTPAPDVCLAATKSDRLDQLADAVETHIDLDALLSLIEHGAPAGLPFIPPGAPV